MPPFHVHIGELSDGALEAPDPRKPTPEVRSVYWRGEAEDEETAREAGYAEWERQYGPGSVPVQALVKVTREES